jgi:hypothetical protein
MNPLVLIIVDWKTPLGNDKATYHYSILQQGLNHLFICAVIGDGINRVGPAALIFQMTISHVILEL